MATSCVKPFVSGTFAPLKRPGPRSGLLKCTDPAVVARSARKRLTVCSCSRNVASLRQRAEDVMSRSGAQAGFLPAVAATLLANLSLVGNAGALDDEEARSTYEAFVKEASSAAARVADKAAEIIPPDAGEAVSDAADAISDVTEEFTSEDALIVGGVLVFAVAVLFGISRLFRKGYGGDVSAQDALRRLDKETSSILVDIRQPNEITEEGSPKLPRSKKALRIRFEREYEGTLVPHPAFVSRVQAKSASKAAAIFVIDTTGGVSVNAAKALAKAGFKKVYAVKGGTEAWRDSELPWLKPTNFTLDLGTLKQAIDDTVKENPNVVPATLGIAAATAGSFLLFSEAETAVQLLGSMVIAQLIINKLLFSEDRQKTVGQLKSFLDTKVAPQDLVDEFEEVRGAFFTSEASAESSYAAPPNSENGAASRNGAASAEYWPAASAERRPAAPAERRPAPPDEYWPATPPEYWPAEPAESRPAPPAEYRRPAPADYWAAEPAENRPAVPAPPKAVQPPVAPKAEQSTRNESEQLRQESIPPRLESVKPFFPSYEEVKQPASNSSSKRS